MTRTIQILRGTEAQNDAFTGAIGELTMDTTNNEIRIHDGSTVGGHKIGGLPDQTGHAGEFLTTDGTDASWSDAIGYHPDLFDHKWADHILNDVQWLRADTFSWQAGSVYQAAYQHLADDITGKTLQSETVGGVTIQFYLSDDGHKICPESQENNVAAIYAATGVAWYYILDTVNQRFKLPRTKFGLTGLRDTVGGYVGAGLPNITGKIENCSILNWTNSGTDAFKKTTKAADSQGNGSGTSIKNIIFDASDSNAIYGASTTVQPPATQQYLYFYVDNFTQTALENTAGINTELFNGKADVSTVAHVVTEFQEPTAANNYTWYRKYADGWVEQGGNFSQTINTSNTAWSATLPIAMANYYYVVNVQTDGGWAAGTTIQCEDNTTTQIKGYARSPDGGGTKRIMWSVSGMAAN